MTTIGLVITIMSAVGVWIVLAAWRPATTASVTAFMLHSPATLIHEFTHAVVGTVTGGIATGIRLMSAMHAETRVLHFTLLSRVLTPVAGYILTPLFGLAVALGGTISQDDPVWQRLPYAALAVVAMGCLLLSRNLLAFAASVWMGTLTFLLWMNPVLPATWAGAVICILAAIAAWGLVGQHAEFGRDVESDATRGLLRAAHPVVPAVMWALFATVCAGCATHLAFVAG